MAVPLSQMWTVASYVIKQKLLGRKHYPLVLMLEPLYRCNLACAGCGKIQYPAHILKQEMDPEVAMKAVDECGAPMVSIPGGEPLMHSRIGEIVAGLVKRKKYIYLCTNALLLKQRLEQGVLKPSKFLTINVHMDGDEEHHDFAVCREGTYKVAEEAIQLAVKMGFRVTTNSTLFKNAEPERMRRFFDRMMEIGVEGMTVSPGYHYQKAPDQQSFLRERASTTEMFRAFFKKAPKKWQFNLSPLFMEFLMGKRHLECTPWGCPAYSLFGWQRPCYLLQEGYARTFKELITETKWENYGRASGNTKCQSCMVHCGYEPSAVNHTFSSIEGFFATARATLFGVDSDRGKNITPPPVTRYIETGVEKAKSDAVTQALADAVDFRGDVTLTLHDGTKHVGYIFNADDRVVEYFPANRPDIVTLARHLVVEVEKTGRDMADGKTWEAWVKKYTEHKEKLARGEKAESIDIFPEVLS
ncbi:MAG: adenosyl-hopene transferase HpnH [Planctomycetaceae bacterium]|nr:hypothetical protein [Planctomycetota bacterium]NUO15775.1 adenosyl-hopene transferase HpnH [Planctomycetaceae bacterium]